MPARGQVTYTPNELEQRIDSYFTECKETLVDFISGKNVHQISRPPTWIGLALHLGVDTRTIARWRDGEYNAVTNAPGTGETIPDKGAQQRVCQILARAEDRIKEDAYLGATLGYYNDRMTQMRLARMGETVKQEVDQTTTVKAVWVGVDPADAAQYSK